MNNFLKGLLDLSLGLLGLELLLAMIDYSFFCDKKFYISSNKFCYSYMYSNKRYFSSS